MHLIEEARGRFPFLLASASCIPTMDVADSFHSHHCQKKRLIMLNRISWKLRLNGSDQEIIRRKCQKDLRKVYHPDG